jgi:hypothetical protein
MGKHSKETSENPTRRSSEREMGANEKGSRESIQSLNLINKGLKQRPGDTSLVVEIDEYDVPFVNHEIKMPIPSKKRKKAQIHLKSIKLS